MIHHMVVIRSSYRESIHQVTGWDINVTAISFLNWQLASYNKHDGASMRYPIYMYV